MIPPQLIIAGIIATASAATGFGAAWKLQSLRADAKEKAYVEQALVDERSAAETAIRHSQAVIQATNAATNRAVALRRDADSARAGLIGLSDATEQALRAASASHAACTERAHAISVVLDQCGAAYQDMGAIADRHANDVQALSDAWPTTTKEN